ncbi:MAG: MoaD family protein [Candidatus Bathyarchaeota archaeon]|nr:MAG: MoaD family protein [Candidatus Bathyarchaeota archaeon]
MTEITIIFSHALISATNNQREIRVKGENLGEILNKLAKRYGNEFKKKLFDKEGKIKRFINIYINGKDTRFLDGLETKLKKGDEILIIPAVSGG